MWKDSKEKRAIRKDLTKRIEIGFSVYNKTPVSEQQKALERLLRPAYAYTCLERKVR